MGDLNLNISKFILECSYNDSTSKYKSGDKSIKFSGKSTLSMDQAEYIRNEIHKYVQKICMMKPDASMLYYQKLIRGLANHYHKCTSKGKFLQPIKKSTFYDILTKTLRLPTSKSLKKTFKDYHYGKIKVSNEILNKYSDCSDQIKLKIPEFTLENSPTDENLDCSTLINNEEGIFIQDEPCVHECSIYFDDNQNTLNSDTDIKIRDKQTRLKEKEKTLLEDPVFNFLSDENIHI